MDQPKRNMRKPMHMLVYALKVVDVEVLFVMTLQRLPAAGAIGVVEVSIQLQR